MKLADVGRCVAPEGLQLALKFLQAAVWRASPEAIIQVATHFPINRDRSFGELQVRRFISAGEKALNGTLESLTMTLLSGFAHILLESIKLCNILHN